MNEDRLRVAVVSEPGKAGVKKHVVALLKHIDLSRFDVAYYYSLQRSEEGYRAEIEALQARGVECVEVPMEGRLGFLHDLRAFLQLTRHLRQRPPAVLHLHSSKAGGLGRLCSRLLFPRPRVLYTPHAMACYRSRFYLWLERFLGLFTDTLVAVSASEKKDFIDWRIPGAAHAHTIPLGVQLSGENSAGSSSDGRSPAAPLRRKSIGACGRISFQKNALLFFQVALEVIKRRPDAHFIWIGDYGDDAESVAVRALLQRAGHPPQIEITGWVKDASRYLSTLEVFCMFSRYESFGYVTAEAMLLGIPVIATEATGTVDLVHHDATGLIVPAEVEPIIAALQRLEGDAALRTRLTQNAQRFIGEHHTIAKMVTATELLFAEAITP